MVTKDKLGKLLEENVSKIDSSREKIREDLPKFLKGNMTAGTRLRKYSQEIKECCSNIRHTIQDIKNIIDEEKSKK